MEGGYKALSTTIDERVVEMRFENSNFENNAKATINTVNKLKDSLNMDDAARGLENVDSTARRMDFSHLSNSISGVSLKFDALWSMAHTVFSRITNAAITTGQQLISSFTIDPIKAGFSEYELKMGSIQTIMSGTGEDLDTVNKYLNDLNEYSDKTIYSFQDMTSNIGKFTNAGVKLDDAVSAIQGVSNVAALSGANANEASRAM